MRWCEVPRTVSVSDAYDDERRHAPVIDQEVDRASDFVDMPVTVGQVEHGKNVFAHFVTMRRAHPDDTVFIENVGVHSEFLRDRRGKILRRRGDNQSGESNGEEQTAREKVHRASGAFRTDGRVGVTSSQDQMEDQGIDG